jgi:hypothetical protein
MDTTFVITTLVEERNALLDLLEQPVEPSQHPFVPVVRQTPSPYGFLSLHPDTAGVLGCDAPNCGASKTNFIHNV